MITTKKIEKYWLKSSSIIDWDQKPKITLKKINNHIFNWYPDGKLNVYKNCISNHILRGDGNKICIITAKLNFEIEKYTFKNIDFRVNQFCQQLKNLKFKGNIKKVLIHASASIESAILMLSFAKLGVHFSVIFEDLEEKAILSRIEIFKPDIFISKWSRNSFFKKFSKKKFNLNSNIFFFHEISKIKKFKNNEIIKNKSFVSNKDFFTLFTSGSTGVPKGVTHCMGGYFVYAKLTCKEQFGMNKNSIVLTASDAGWINGHTYALFGPLSFGCTTVLLESPMLLTNINFLKKILSLKITILYLPVTLIRIIKSILKNKIIRNRHLKTIGSMGEPLAPSVGKWFEKTFLQKGEAIINTYFQTETGGIICSPKYSNKCSKNPHGSVGDTISKYIKIIKLSENKKSEIKIISPWPGMMKKIINGKKEWNKYWDSKNNFRLFDIATRKKNNVFIHGRIDDVINIRGHRIGSDEIESTVLKLSEIYECSAISKDDKLEGKVLNLFVVSKEKNMDNKIENTIFNNFGSFAIPKSIYYLNELPKTRSGKILRRLLRKIVENPKLQNYGDTTTILNPNVIDKIKKEINVR